MTGKRATYRSQQVWYVFNGTLGAPKHPDLRLIRIVRISIITEDEVGGLEYMKDWEWFNATPLANYFVINLGDMMQVLSDDEYKGVLHKVGKIMRKKERYSIIYFVFPDKEYMFESSRYKPFKFSEYEARVKLDIEKHGSKIGFSNFLNTP